MRKSRFCSITYNFKILSLFSNVLSSTILYNSSCSVYHVSVITLADWYSELCTDYNTLWFAWANHQYLQFCSFFFFKNHWKPSVNVITIYKCWVGSIWWCWVIIHWKRNFWTGFKNSHWNQWLYWRFRFRSNRCRSTL